MSRKTALISVRPDGFEIRQVDRGFAKEVLCTHFNEYNQDSTLLA